MHSKNFPEPRFGSAAILAAAASTQKKRRSLTPTNQLNRCGQDWPRSGLARQDLKALLSQARQQFIAMRAIPCFDNTMHFHGIDVVACKSSIMRHLDDTRALGGDNPGKSCQPA